MIGIRLVLAKLRALLRNGRDDADLAQELAAHVDLLTEDLVRQGLSLQAARRQARLRVGGTQQVVLLTREQRGLPWIEQLGRDLRLAVRSLRRNPLFAVTAVVSLAVGVAANTVGFAFLYGYLIRPLPFADGSRLVSVLTAAPSRGVDRWSTTLLELDQIRTRSRSFDAIAAVSVADVDLTGGDEPRRLMASVVSPDLHRQLGIRPLRGRVFDDGDGRATAGQVVILGERLWRTAFAADDGIVGRAITLDRRSYSVVGVLPATEGFSPHADIWLPIGPDEQAQPRERRYRFVAHLAPGATVDAANHELEVLSAAIAKAYPEENTGVRLFAEHLRADLLDDNREPVLILYGVVSLVLLLACANVATLLVMRSASRSGEFAIRASLGAGRLQIVRQVLVEHAVVTVTGGALGVVAGVWVRDLLVAVLPQTAGPFRFTLDGPGTALLCGVVLMCAFLFGAFSAWSITRQSFSVPGRAGRDGEARADRAGVRTGLAVFEVSAAVLVLVGTGLMLKGALHVASQPPGFDSRNVLTMEINLPESNRYQEPAQAVQFFRDLTARIGALPQVERVSAANPLPYVGWNIAYEAQGSQPTVAGQRPRTMDAVVMPGYFRTLRIPLLEGRDFSEVDTRPTSAPVIVVSQSFARATWPGESAIGRRVRLLRRGAGEAPWREVVGVVGDTRASTFAPERGWVYVPHGQPAITELVLAIRFNGDHAALIRDVRKLVWEVEPALPVHWNDLLADLIARRYWQPRAYSVVFSVFSALALAVALVGVYAVVSFTSARRTREFGIRLAIGSSPAQVWQLVLRQGLRLAFVGTAIGMVAAFGVMRLASTVFFGVSPTDGWVYATCGALAMAAVLLATATPAWRAARIDPVTVLRCD